MEEKKTNTTAAVKTAKTETVKKLDELKFTAKAFMDEFEDPDTGETREYVSITMPNVVEPEDGDVVLAFNSDKNKDENGKIRNNKVKTLFKYDAKKYLQTAEKVEISGVIRYKSFYDKKEKKDINFVSIVIFNPFDDGAAINMYLKNFEAATLLERYVKKNFNIYIEEGESLKG